MNSLQELMRMGQSIWLDYIRRDLMTSGKLQNMIKDEGVTGLTSNPTIFAKAFSEASDYNDVIRKIVRQSPDLDTRTLFEKVEIDDLQMAADFLSSTYDWTDGNDGFVSIEVSPHLAYDTERTIAEARRLWHEVNRRNVMVKIPATVEGLPAIEQCLSEGINVNITLMFSVSQYEDVAQTYLRAMQKCSDPKRVTSVASFFVSRVDTAVDRALEEIGTPEALALRGKAGIANGKLAYRRFRQLFFGPQFEPWKSRGVRIQKPLWASTSTKNKAYSDVMYVEGLAGPDTINSMPPETLEAFRDHGKAKNALIENPEQSEEVVGRLQELGIRLRSIGQELTEEGVEKFVASYDEALKTLDRQRASLVKAA